MIKIMSVSLPLEYSDDLIFDIVATRLRIPKDSIISCTVRKKAPDCSDRTNIKFTATILANVREEEHILIRKKDLAQRILPLDEYFIAQKQLDTRPLVIGCGPAGLFAALILAQAGTNPIVIERGEDVDSRQQSVETFWHTGQLNTRSNVQFGEGGAGTFSDGKLKPGALDLHKYNVLKELVRFGAPKEILCLAKPHIGTDKLRTIVKNMRQEIIALGGEYHFMTKMVGLVVAHGHVQGVRIESNGTTTELEAKNVVLAIGHSARDTIEMLYATGVPMIQKNFGLGVRIEHPQTLIDEIQYGKFARHPALGAADYRLVEHIPGGRSVYTFCMCPGGQVVASTSEESCVVTNGMSQYARNGANANSAMLVSLNERDYGSTHPLAGIALQRQIENAAYHAGGGNYRAPVQLLGDFMDDVPSTAFGKVLPSYLPGTSFAKVASYLPSEIAQCLRYGLEKMFLWMPGYNCPDAVITGAETRTTSPVQIVRNEKLVSPVADGLYPCGEGAGYAGGIISSAVDGIKCAESILENRGHAV